MGHKIFVGSKISYKSCAEAVIEGFFKVAAMTIHELASKMKMLEEQLENPAVPSSLKQLPAWLRDFSALLRRAAIFHLCSAKGGAKARGWPVSLESRRIAHGRHLNETAFHYSSTRKFLKHGVLLQHYSIGALNRSQYWLSTGQQARPPLIELLSQLRLLPIKIR